MIHRNMTIRARTVVVACTLGATIGISALASAGGESPDTNGFRPAPGAQPTGPTEPRERLLELGRDERIPIVADQMRTVPAPGPKGNAPGWLLAPLRDGGVCVDTSRVGFCGTSRASIEAGRASATEYPPDEILGRDPRTGFAMIKPSDGTGVRYGIAPSEADEVVVLDPDKRVLHRKAVSEEGAYQVPVPPQGSDARVTFEDSSGDTVASQPAG